MNFFNKFDKLHNNYKDKKFIVLSLFLGIFGVFFITMGSSFAYITYQDIGEGINKISAGNVLVSFLDESDAITLDKAIPQTDEDALKNNPSHSFKVSNTGGYDLKYKLSLISTCNVGDEIVLNGNIIKIDKCIPSNFIKVAIKYGDGDYIIKNINEDGSIDLTDMIVLENNSNSLEYSIKIWLSLDTPNEYSGIDSDGNTINSIFTGKVNIYGEQMVEEVHTSDYCFDIIDGIISNYNCYYGNNKELNTVRYVSIPDKIDGVPIIGIGDNVFYKKDILAVELPSSITSIGVNSFTGNEGLKVTFINRVDNSGILMQPDSFDSDTLFLYQ